jgi:transcriptional regulator with XRE-family HTH domain
MTQQSLPGWKALRDLAGLSQREVERRCGMSTGRLSVIERGLIPTEAEAARLKEVLLAAVAEPKAIA